MELRQLSMFLSAASHGTLTDAAKSLYVSQPTVSVQLAALEKELGVTLFERQSRGVVLTPAGRILKRYAVDMLMLRDQAVAAMEQYSTDITGSVRVLASTVPADYVLPQILSSFLDRYPRVLIELSRAASHDVLQHVLNYDVELGFVGFLGNEPDLESVAIMEDEVIIITPPTEKFSNWSERVDLDTILAEPMVCRRIGSGTQKTFEDALMAHGVHPDQLDVRARLESAEAIKAAVACGTGIAVISGLVAAEQIADGSLRGFRIKGFDMKRRFYMIAHKKKVLSPAVEAFRQFILEKVGVE